MGDLDALALIAEAATDLFDAHAFPPEVPDAAAWGEALLDGERPQACDPDLWLAARDRYAELAARQGPTALLHGDLHHDNLLLDRDRGWIAIDPKGVVAEAAFELGCALRNPVDSPAFVTHPDVMAARIGLLGTRYGHDRRRLVGWAYTQAVLAAAWSVADRRDPLPFLAVARAYRGLEQG